MYIYGHVENYWREIRAQWRKVIHRVSCTWLSFYFQLSRREDGSPNEVRVGKWSLHRSDRNFEMKKGWTFANGQRPSVMCWLKERDKFTFKTLQTVSKDSTCIDLRQYWIPPDKTDIVPTTKGICLRPQENCRLKEFITDIENILPHLSTIILCLFEDDHMNQMALMGMLRCSEYNPNSFTEY